MASTSSTMLVFNIYFLFILYISVLSDGTELIIVNNCKETIWPGLLGTAGHPTPNSGGFSLGSGEAQILDLPENWSGRIWPRTGCCFADENNGGCETGDCAGLLRCSGHGGEPPATTVEMTLGTPESAVRFYDVSLVGGFNVPASMAEAGRPPGGGGPDCGTAACEADVNEVCPAACEADVNEVCPAALVVRGGGGRVVGCKSQCLAAAEGSPESDRYCCRGEFARPEKCRPTVVGRVFKAVCPRAYSYAFDEASGLMTCMADRYVITFCPLIY